MREEDQTFKNFIQTLEKVLHCAKNNELCGFLSASLAPRFQVGRSARKEKNVR